MRKYIYIYIYISQGDPGNIHARWAMGPGLSPWPAWPRALAQGGSRPLAPVLHRGKVFDLDFFGIASEALFLSTPPLHLSPLGGAT